MVCMGRLLLSVIALLGFVFQPSGQAQEVEVPAWMQPFLPKTPDEKAKAAFYDSQGSWTLEPGKGMVTIVCGMGIGFGFDTPPPYYEFVNDTVCSTDAVVLGTAQPSAVRMNNKRTYLYTEFSIDVSRALKLAGQTQTAVEVLTPGGHIQTSAGAVTVSISGSPQLEGGKEYLLFLKRVPGTKAFTPTNVLTRDSEWPRKLHGPLPYELQSNEVPFDRFVDDLEMAATRCHKGRRP